MSLVGNLEDLGLDEIFQIAGISGKTGVLQLRNGNATVRILFEAGQIRAAFDDRDSLDLGDLALKRGLLSAEALSQLRDATRASGRTLGAALIELGHVDAAGLQALLRGRIDRLVSDVFQWERGEFSFDLGELRAEGGDAELMLENGLNPQFVALEAARLIDEAARGRDEPEPPPDTEPAGELAGELQEWVSSADEEEVGPDGDEPTPQPDSALAPEPNAAPSPTPAAAPEISVDAEASVGALLPVVAVDEDLATLEWVKEALEPTKTRIHILQRSEQAVSRVRQYVLRGEAAVALVTHTTPADPVSGARDWAALAARLRAQVPKQLVLFLGTEDDIPAALDPTSRPDAVADRPDPTMLSDPRAEPQRHELAQRLRETLARMQGQMPTSRSADLDPWRAKWESVRERLRHAPNESAIWEGLLDFAAQGFERTALFTIREEEATGVGARVRREAAEPADPRCTESTLSVGASAWLRKVVETRSALRAAPADDGDRALIRGLGDECPDEAFVAPIERCGTLVAVLYGDNAIRRGTVPDTRPLEPVLKEAGLALERLPANS